MGRGKSSVKRGERGEMKKVLTTTLRVAVRRVAARVNQKVEAAVEVVKKVVLGVRRAVTKMRGDLPQAGERRSREGQRAPQGTGGGRRRNRRPEREPQDMREEVPGGLIRRSLQRTRRKQLS